MWQKPGFSQAPPPSAAWCWLGTHQSPVAQPSSPLVRSDPSSYLGGWKKLKSTRPHIKPALQMTHQGYTLFTSGIFLLILSPMHLFCCLLLFQTHFSAPCTDFWTTFDKDDPGSRVINIIFLTCLALSATCNCSLPRFGSSSLTFLQLPRSFPCFLSPWVCAAFSVSS